MNDDAPEIQDAAVSPGGPAGGGGATSDGARPGASPANSGAPLEMRGDSPLTAIRRQGRQRRIKRALAMLEWIVAFILVGVGLYFLWFLVFPPAETGTVARQYTREDFRARLRALPATVESPGWLATNPSPRWRRIVIHHTATDSGTVEAFDRNHREERKWENGLGYHFVIGNGRGMTDGEVAVGKRWREQLDGAHVGGGADRKLNETSIGIALVGNFEHDLPTARQLASLKALLNFLRRECNIGLASIVGHRDMSSTACPGKNIYLDEVLLVLANS
ncbi:MAG: peptidoglycan recognition protein family protein [Planctomycetota bacterium]|nr:peptidoglycan recognition protein family protein [Planctomycetota bacterium]